MIGNILPKVFFMKKQHFLFLSFVFSKTIKMIICEIRLIKSDRKEMKDSFDSKSMSLFVPQSQTLLTEGPDVTRVLLHLGLAQYIDLTQMII